MKKADLAYVPIFRGNSVSVVDIYQSKIIRNISVGQGPTRVVISCDQEFAYVPNFLDATVSVIKIKENKVIKTIALNQGSFTAANPQDIAISPNGDYLYVVNYGSNNISVVNISRYEVVTTVQLNSGGVSIDLTTDGDFAYVCLSLTNQVAVVDLRVNLVVKYIIVGLDPEGIKVSKHLAAVANYGSNSLTFINTRIAEASPTTIPIGAGPIGLTFHPDGSRVYLTNQLSNNVSVVDVFLHQEILTIPTGAAPRGLAITSDGKYLVVANNAGNSLVIIETTTNRIISTIEVGPGPLYPTILSLPRI